MKPSRKIKESPLLDRSQITTTAKIFGIALLLRVAYWIFLKENYFFYNNPSTDVLYYREWAEAIARGHGGQLKDFIGLPLYPYFLAVVRNLSFNNPALITFAHLILGSINSVLVYFLSRAFFPRATSFLAALLVASNFILIHYDWLGMPVSLIIFLSLGILLALVHHEHLRSTREWIIVGGLIGLALQGDPKFIFFFPAVLFWILDPKRNVPQKSLHEKVVPLIFGFFIIIGLVMIQQRAIWGRWFLVSPQSGFSLYVGNNPQATGVFENPEFIRPTHGGQDADQRIFANQASGQNFTVAETDHFWKDKAFNFIRKDPSAFLNLIFQKARFFLSDTEAAHEIDLLLQRDWRRWLDFNPFFVIGPFAIVGWFLSRRQDRRLRLLDFLILSQLFITLIFFHSTRHRASVLPLLIIYEAFFLTWLAQHIREKKWRTTLPAIVFCAIFFWIFPPQVIDARTIDFLRHSKSGAIYLTKGDLVRAKTECELALTLRPDDSNSLYNIGTAYLMEGDTATARHYFEMSLRISPLNVDTLFNLGYAYESEGDLSAAIATFQKVLRWQPRSIDILFRIGEIYGKQGDCRRAQEYYRQILFLNPESKNQLIKQAGPCFLK